MKKHLINYIQLVVARMRFAFRMRVTQLNQNKMELLGSHPLNAIGLKVVNTLSVVSVFMLIALMVNAPLRAELVKSLTSEESSELASSDSDAPVMEKVAFMDPAAFGIHMPPEVQQAPVPSIAPLADRIPNSLIDPQAVDMKLLKNAQDQQLIADFLANKYRTDPMRVRQYIAQTMTVAREVNLDPVLLIAVMAIESNFNPYAQSGAGAQGLMQVMTKVHLNKFAPYGGASAAFKPEANIRVGAYILKYYIAQAGSLNGGLRYYVGGPAISVDGGYVGKVLRERELLIGMLQKGGSGDSTTASINFGQDI